MFRKIGVTVILLFLLTSCASPEPSTPLETVPPTEVTIPATEATEVPTEPEPVEYVLSFVGDCCLANKKGWSTRYYFIGTVGDNYEYPFEKVQDYFSTDDCTFVNLENPLTDAKGGKTKAFVFKGPMEYTNILTAGNVEFANIVNNHIKDYYQEGYDDTISALDQADLYYAEPKEPTVFTTESGLTIGVYADLHAKDVDGLEEKIIKMRDDGAEIIIVSMHWGQEYYYKPNKTQVKLAHAAIDAGADIVYGHHPHVLQPVEEYNGKMIYYSLGNFSFGGNTNPPDKDTAIVQQTIIRNPDGSVQLGELEIIPCAVTSLAKGNDYQPVPLEPDSEAYQRVLSKLDGSYEKHKLHVPYR